MQINPQVQNLTALFSIRNEQFIIPPYQRRYSWNKKQVNALFQDIKSLSLVDADQDGHFFGMLLLHSHIHTTFNRLEIIDGQQRLTTITILLKSIQKAFIKVGNNGMADDINYYIKSSNSGTVYNKLILGNLDSADYNIIMNDGNLDEIKNDKLKGAIILFDDLIGGLVARNALEDFWEKLMGKAVIIRLDVGTVRDSFKLFETINNRGLKLSATDIIKNLLFGHASKLNNGQYLETVKTIWSEIILNLDGINSNNTDIFFRRYFCSVLRRKVTSNGLVEEFKKYYYYNVQGANLLGLLNDTITAGAIEEDEEDEEDNIIIDDINEELDQNNSITIIEFIRRIKTASIEYNKLYFEDYDDSLIKREVISLNKIQCEPTYIFLMQFMNLNVENNVKLQVLKILSSLMLRRHICKRQTGETDQIFSSLVRVIDEIEQIDVFIQNLKDIILNNDYYPSDEEFRQHLLKYDFKGKSEKRARALLEFYNTSLGNGLNEILIADADEVHLEHIIPQKITSQNAINENRDWVQYLGANAVINHKLYIYKIGNLTLLAAPINMSISNNPFHRKKSGYERSEITMSRDLSTYNDFKFEQVEQRGMLITESVINHWRIDF